MLGGTKCITEPDLENPPHLDAWAQNTCRSGFSFSSFSLPSSRFFFIHPFTILIEGSCAHPRPFQVRSGVDGIEDPECFGSDGSHDWLVLISWHPSFQDDFSACHRSFGLALSSNSRFLQDTRNCWWLFRIGTSLMSRLIFLSRPQVLSPYQFS